MTENLRFQNKTVWITGAETSMGQAIARRFFREGARLLLSGVSEVPDGLGDCVCYGKNPLTEEDADAALRLVDRLDILVTATRFVERLSILECEAADFDRSMDENLTSVFCASRAAIKKMGREQGGSMLFVGSVHGKQATGCAFLYSMASGGLHILTQEASLDFGRLGVRVNLLCPGALEGDEELFSSDLTGIYYDLDSKIPRKRPGTCDEVAAVAAFLSSDEASFINGAALMVDGGFLHYYVDADVDTRWENGFGGVR